MPRIYPGNAYRDSGRVEEAVSVFRSHMNLPAVLNQSGGVRFSADKSSSLSAIIVALALFDPTSINALNLSNIFAIHGCSNNSSDRTRDANYCLQDQILLRRVSLKAAAEFKNYFRLLITSK
jgi:hypothetical protein